MLGAQLAPWRLWRSGLGRNGTARAASFGLRTNQVTGAQGPQENCDSHWEQVSNQPLGCSCYLTWSLGTALTQHTWLLLQLYPRHTTKHKQTLCTVGGGDDSNRRRRDPSRWEGLMRQLTSRPSLRHLVSWVLVLIHGEAVYLQHQEAS
jgi:hypothetical protein